MCGYDQVEKSRNHCLAIDENHGKKYGFTYGIQLPYFRAYFDPKSPRFPSEDRLLNDFVRDPTTYTFCCVGCLCFTLLFLDCARNIPMKTHGKPL